MLEIVLVVGGVIAVLAAAASIARKRRARGVRIYPLPVVIGLVTGFATVGLAGIVTNVTALTLFGGILAGWFGVEGAFDAWKQTGAADRVFADPGAKDADEEAAPTPATPAPASAPAKPGPRRPQDYQRKTTTRR